MSVYDLVTARILQQLEKGTAPWRRPWGGPMRVPRNLTTLKPYRGVNVFLLACQGYEAPFWLTYRQAQEIGGHVRKGEHGSPVVFWTEWERADKETGELSKIPILRHGLPRIASRRHRPFSPPRQSRRESKPTDRPL